MGRDVPDAMTDTERHICIKWLNKSILGLFRYVNGRGEAPESIAMGQRLSLTPATGKHFLFSHGGALSTRMPNPFSIIQCLAKHNNGDTLVAGVLVVSLTFFLPFISPCTQTPIRPDCPQGNEENDSLSTVPYAMRLNMYRTAYVRKNAPERDIPAPSSSFSKGVLSDFTR